MTPCVGWVPTLLPGHAFDPRVVSMSNDSFNRLANWGEQWISEPLDECPPSARMTTVLANPWDCASLHIQGLYGVVNFIVFLKWCTTIPNLFYYSPGLYFFFFLKMLKSRGGMNKPKEKNEFCNSWKTLQGRRSVCLSLDFLPFVINF